MSQKKSNTKKTSGRITKEDAHLLFKAINQEGVSEDARVDITQFIDDVITSTLLSDYVYNEELFMRYFPEGWKDADLHSRRNVARIIERLKAGESIEEIHNAFEQERARRRAQMLEEERNKPEPKNWLSSEWRYWKIRKLAEGITSGDREAYRAAWHEYKALLSDLIKDESFYHVDFALQLLAGLINVRQDIAHMIGSPKTKPDYFKKGGAR